MYKFRYPPCNLNPTTEKPYVRHKWKIAEGAESVTKNTKNGPIVYYRVHCVRCGLNDPHPPAH